MCGYPALPAIVNSTSHLLYLSMKSDNNHVNSGFKAVVYESEADGDVDLTPPIVHNWWCNVYSVGNAYTLSLPTIGSTLTITSPNYPGDYSNHECEEWVITGPLGSTLTITIDALATEAFGACEADYLGVYDGSNRDTAPTLNWLCGNPTVPIVATTTSNAAYVVFKSDEGVVDSGFSADIEAT